MSNNPKNQMIPDWQRKQMSDAYFANVPAGLKHKQAISMQEGRQVPVKRIPRSAYKTFLEHAHPVAASPPAMLMTQVPSAVLGEPGPDGQRAITGPGTNDGHDHTATFDASGNGATDEVDGHTHLVRSFVVAPAQSPDDTEFHDHPGILMPASGTEPQSAYDGQVHSHDGVDGV